MRHFTFLMGFIFLFSLNSCIDKTEEDYQDYLELHATDKKDIGSPGGKGGDPDDDED